MQLHDNLIELGQHKWTTKKGDKLTWADIGLREAARLTYNGPKPQKVTA